MQIIKYLFVVLFFSFEFHFDQFFVIFSSILKIQKESMLTLSSGIMIFKRFITLSWMDAVLKQPVIQPASELAMLCDMVGATIAAIFVDSSVLEVERESRCCFADVGMHFVCFIILCFY